MCLKKVKKANTPMANAQENGGEDDMFYDGATSGECQDNDKDQLLSGGI